MDIKVLVRKGVSEVLEILGDAEGNSALADELREKTEINADRLRLLVDQGLLEKSDEKVVVRKVSIKRRQTTYSVSDKARRLLELCENFSEEEAKDFLSVKPYQLGLLRILLKEGPKQARDIDTAGGKLMWMAKRGLLDKKTEEVESTQDVYRLKRTYILTENGTKIRKALQIIKSVRTKFE